MCTDNLFDRTQWLKFLREMENELRNAASLHEAKGAAPPDGP
jgi:hypothetical protein